MKKLLMLVLCSVTLFAGAGAALGQSAPPVVVFSEAGFPTADTATIPAEQLPKMVPGRA